MDDDHNKIAVIIEFHRGMPVASYMKSLNWFERLWYRLVRGSIRPVTGAEPVKGDIGFLITRELYRRIITCDEPVYRAQQQLDTGLVQAKFVVNDHERRIGQEPQAV